MRAKWVPGGFDQWITLAAKLILLATMMVRGLDYLTGDSADTARRLSTIESAAPLQLWGTLFVTGAIIGFVSMIVRSSIGVMWGHAIGAVCYLSVAVGLGADVIERSEQSFTWIATLTVVTVAGLVLGPWSTRYASKGNYLPVIVVAFALSTTIGLLTVPFDGLRNATVFICLAVLHLLMTIGTASRIRQDQVLEARYA